MKRQLLFSFIIIGTLSLSITSCKKDTDSQFNNDKENLETLSNSNDPNGHLKQTKTFSSEVALKWLDMQVRILKLNTFSLNPSRYFAYGGIALYESVLPGMPAYQTLALQLTNMPTMPKIDQGLAYHWPTCANAALAYMNKSFFASVPVVYINSMDSLENALNMGYQTEVSEKIYNRSVAFGKAVAQLIFNWSTTDGSLTINPPYVPSFGPGLWAPTPPNFGTPVGPYWGNNRQFVQGSFAGSTPPLPPPYSINPNSGYYAMVKEVFDISQTLTPAQTATAIYYRDNPGLLSGAHYISMFTQLLENKRAQLDFAALAYAKTGIGLAESFIACWKIKYQHNVERPIKYIREVLNHPTWSPIFNTPSHPDFPSGHSAGAGAMEVMFTDLFGNISFTNHAYDYLGMPSRTYASFADMADDVGRSRVYAGIHYTYSCTAGRNQGKKIAQNVINILKFRKE